MSDEQELSGDVRRLVRISAALATRDDARVRAALQGAVGRVSAREVEEILVQSYLFLGYPAALNALAHWREVSGEEASEEESEPGSEAGSEGPELWRERGPRVCREVYGEAYPALRQNIRSLHPEMDRWMVEEGYGKVLGRPGVPLRVRELCVAALLAVLDAPVQLHSHLRGSLEVGASEREVEAALGEARAYMSRTVARRADGVWDRVRDRITERR